MNKKLKTLKFSFTVMGIILLVLSCCKEPTDKRPTVTDIDGNVYHTVTIDTLIWMVENLKTTKFRNGDSIPKITNLTEWVNLTTSGYCYYNNDYLNIPTYGLLYNWYAANDSRNIAPFGWHVATANEWTSLVNYLGGEAIAGGKLKETGTTHWSNPNLGATNDVGFTALPGGWRYTDGLYSTIFDNGYWWTSTEYNATYGWFSQLGHDVIGGGLGFQKKKIGMSIRCVKD